MNKIFRINPTAGVIFSKREPERLPLMTAPEGKEITHVVIGRSGFHDGTFSIVSEHQSEDLAQKRMRKAQTEKLGRTDEPRWTDLQIVTASRDTDAEERAAMATTLERLASESAHHSTGQLNAELAARKLNELIAHAQALLTRLQTETDDAALPCGEVVCGFCNETENLVELDESQETHQQWQCQCCGSWNDK